MSEDEENQSEQSVVDVAAGLILAAISIVTLAWIIPANVNSSVAENDVSPAFFPNLAMWLLLGLSLSLVISRIVQTRNFGHAVTTSTSWKPIVSQAFIWHVVGTLAFLGLANIGFLATSSILVILGGLACHFRNWWLLGGLAIIFPIVVVQISWIVFEVNLP